MESLSVERLPISGWQLRPRYAIQLPASIASKPARLIDPPTIHNFSRQLDPREILRFAQNDGVLSFSATFTACGGWVLQGLISAG
jgi:hypothetical protein